MIPDFQPFVRVKPRQSAGFFAFLDRCAHRAFVDGATQSEAAQNLAAHCAKNEANIRHSMVVLGLLPKDGKLDGIHRLGATFGLPVH